VGFIFDHLSEDSLCQVLSDPANNTPVMKEHCACLVELFDTLLLNPLSIESRNRKEICGPFGQGRTANWDKINHMLDLIELCKNKGGDPSLLTQFKTINEEGELDVCGDKNGVGVWLACQRTNTKQAFGEIGNVIRNRSSHVTVWSKLQKLGVSFRDPP